MSEEVSQLNLFAAKLINDVLDIVLYGDLDTVSIPHGVYDYNPLSIQQTTRVKIAELIKQEF